MTRVAAGGCAPRFLQTAGRGSWFQFLTQLPDVVLPTLAMFLWASRRECDDGAGVVFAVEQEGWSTGACADGAVACDPAGQDRWRQGSGSGCTPKPDLVKTFRLSGDPRFGEALIDVVGLSLNCPDKVIVCAWTRTSRCGC